MATPTKWGKEFLVNAHTKGSQGSLTITGLADGRFVVVWEDENGDKSGDGLRAQVFNADGTKAGGDLRVNTTTQGYQAEPAIATLADGRFVVAWADWSEKGGDKYGAAVRAQLFDGDGSKLGGEFQVNTLTIGSQIVPTISALPGGGFVVAWGDLSTLDASVETGGDVRAQIFGADGRKFGGEFLVNTTSTANGPASTSLDDGRFVIAWSGHHATVPGTYVLDVRAQIFNGDGSTSGGEFLVNTGPEHSQYGPRITSLAGGGFVVAWTDETVLPTSISRAVLAQVFNADGSKSGGEIAFEANGAGVTALADGRFVMAGSIRDGSDWDVRAQLFNADGSKSGGEFLVNTTMKHAQGGPVVTALADGRFVVAWTDWSKTGGDKSGTAVRGQVFDPREAAIDLVGSEHDDQFVGTRFDDILDGADGNDWLFGEAGNDRLDGGNGNDVLEGGKGSDTLEGLLGKDVLEAGNGNDVLAGGEHRDKLKGGGGADQFVFREMGKANADKLVDFKPGNDHLVLDSDIFTGIGSTLGREQFEVGNKPDDTNDRVVYDRDKGRLYFDGDGAGGDSQVLFAKVEPGLKLGVGDFVIA